MRQIISYLILCGVCCVVPVVSFTLGWLLRGGRFHVPGLSDSLSKIRARRLAARVSLGSAKPGRGA